jgi:hypothetical protein
MSDTQIPTETHPGFEAICSEVEDFEPLPTVTTASAPLAAKVDDEDGTASLDGLILAGLVSP